MPNIGQQKSPLRENDNILIGTRLFYLVNLMSNTLNFSEKKYKRYSFSQKLFKASVCPIVSTMFVICSLRRMHLFYYFLHLLMVNLFRFWSCLFVPIVTFCWFGESPQWLLWTVCPKILGGGGTCKCHSVTLWLQIEWSGHTQGWWGHSNVTCRNRNNLNFFEHTGGRDAKTSCPCPCVKLSLTILLDTGAIGVFQYIVVVQS